MLATTECLYPVHLSYNQPGGITDPSTTLLVQWKCLGGSCSLVCCTSPPNLIRLLSKTLPFTAIPTCLSLPQPVWHKAVHALVFPSQMVADHVPSSCRSSIPSSTHPSFATTHIATFLHVSCPSQNTNNFNTLVHCWKTTVKLLWNRRPHPNRAHNQPPHPPGMVFPNILPPRPQPSKATWTSPCLGPSPQKAEQMLMAKLQTVTRAVTTPTSRQAHTAGIACSQPEQQAELFFIDTNSFSRAHHHYQTLLLQHPQQQAY